MPISISCSSCNRALKVKDELAGKRVKCPQCAGVIQIPAAEPEIRIQEEAPASAPDPEIRIQEEEPGEAPSNAPAARGERPGRPSRAGARPVRGAGRALRAAGQDAGPAVLVRCLIGGLVGAFLGALVWFVVAKGVSMKIGWLAWGIGWAAGFGVVALSGGKSHALLPLLGAGCALFGWLAGEYMIYIWAVPDFLMEELSKSGELPVDEDGNEIPKEIVVAFVLSELTFTEYLKNSFEFIDTLFIVLAVATGFGVPKKMIDGE